MPPCAALAHIVLPDISPPPSFLRPRHDSLPGAAGPVLRAHVRGAEGQNHVTIVDAGHFLQEDKGPELAEAVVEFIAANPG